MKHTGDVRRDTNSGPVLKESGPELCKDASKFRFACVAFGLIRVSKQNQGFP